MKTEPVLMRRRYLRKTKECEPLDRQPSMIYRHAANHGWKGMALFLFSLLAIPVALFAQSPPTYKRLPQGSPCAAARDLFEAIKRDDACTVSRLLKKGANVHDRTREVAGLNRTPLHWAAAFGNAEIVKLLLDHNADVNARDEYGATPLHASSEDPDASLRVAQILVSRGADVNAKNTHGFTTLHYHIMNIETARFLISKGTEINGRDVDGCTPLYYIAKEGKNKSHLDMIGFLLDQGADVRAQCKDGASALLYARKIDIVKLLVSRGADMNAISRNGVTPLEVQLMEGDMDLLPADDGIPEFLIQAGADVRIATADGFTPLHFARNREIAQIMIQRGADIHARTKHDRIRFKYVAAESTPLHTAVIHGRADVATLLLSEGASVNAKNANGETPLHIAAEKGWIPLIKILIDHGGDPHARNENGSTPADCTDSEEAKGILLDAMRKTESKQ